MLLTEKHLSDSKWIRNVRPNHGDSFSLLEYDRNVSVLLLNQHFRHSVSLSLGSPLELTSLGPSVSPLADTLAHSPAMHAAVAPTPTPVLEVKVDVFNHYDSLPVRGDVLPPLQLPPLPTTRSKPSQLDISQGLAGGGQTASGGGESSGEGGGYSPATAEPSLGIETGRQPAVVFKEAVTPGTGLVVDKSPAVPAAEESAKPPFHLIIVNVKDQNQSGE